MQTGLIMMMNWTIERANALSLVLGTHFRAPARRFCGDVLLFDTEEAVLDYEDHRTKAVHLELPPHATIAPQIPNRHHARAGRDGSSFDSSFARAIYVYRADAYKQIIEQKVKDKRMVYLLPSKHGGTGSGIEKPVRRHLCECSFDGRLIVVHDVDVTINPEKPVMWLRDLVTADKHDAGLDILIGHADRFIEEIAQIDITDWARIEGILCNMRAPAVENPIKLLQVRRLEVREEDVVRDVVREVVRWGVPVRLEGGDPDLSEQARRRSRQQLDEAIELLRNHLRISASPSELALEPAAARGAEILREHAVDRAEQLFTPVREDLLATCRLVRQEIPRLGRPYVEERLGEFIEECRVEAERLYEMQAHDNWTQTTEEAAGKAQSWRYQLFPSRTLATADVAHFVNRELRYRAYSLVATELDDLMQPPMSFGGDELPPRYRLPESSSIRRTLLDLYLDAEDHDEGVRRVESHVREHLPEILVEVLLPSLGQDLDFDFKVSQEARNARGLIVRSRYAGRIQPLIDRFHVHDIYTKHEHDDGPRLEFIHFVLIKQIQDVPALHDMVQRVEERSATSEDRRLYARTAEDIWPQQLREHRGVSLDEGALVLAKAYLVPHALRVLRSGIELRDHEGRLSRHVTFEAFCNDLSLHDETALHRAFWMEVFAQDRTACLRTLEELVAGPSSGPDVQRYERLQRFVQTRRWQRALGALLRQVQVADTYWLSS